MGHPHKQGGDNRETSPFMYGRTYMGIERATLLVGRDGTVARVWRNVKVPGHVDEVLAAAKAL